MIFVLPPCHKSHSYLFLISFFWCAMAFNLSHASMTVEELYTNLSIAQEAIKDDDPDLAEDVLRKILQAQNDNATAHRLLGSVLLKKGLRNDAINELTRSLEIDPQDELTREYLFSIYYNRAQELLKVPSEAYKAREELEKAISIRPDGIMSYYFLGTLNYQENRDKECITTLLKVADTIPEKLKSNLHIMIYNSAYKLLNQKRPHDAKDVIPYFSTPLQATINELLLTATISLEIGDFAKSIELYNRVLIKDPLHAIALQNRSIAQQRLDEILQAETAMALLQQEKPVASPTENFSKLPETSVTSAPYK